MTAAFSRFNKFMDVPLMVTANDMMTCDIHFKGTVTALAFYPTCTHLWWQNNVYIAEIRNSYINWYDDMKKQFELAKKESSEDLNNIIKGNEKFDEGC